MIRKPMALAGLIVAVHLACLQWMFPFTDVLKPDPYVSIDFAMHFYNVHATSGFATSGLHVWGYDPYFMAGYPAGLFMSLDNRALELLCRLMAFAPIPILFKLFVLGSFLVAPLLIYRGARHFGLERNEALWATALSVLFLHFDSTFVTIRLAGMYSFTFSMFLSLHACSILYRYLGSGGKGTLAAWILAVVAATFVHPLSLVPTATACLFMALPLLRKSPFVSGGAFLLCSVLLLVTNLPWAYPILKFGHYLTPPPIFTSIGGPGAIEAYLNPIGVDPLGVTVRAYAARIAIIVLALAGLRLWWSRRPVMLLRVISGTAVVLGLIALLGGYFPLVSGLGHYRYFLTMCLLLCIPAGAGAVHLWNERGRMRAWPRPFRISLWISAGVAVLFFTGGVASLELTIRDHFRPKGILPEETQSIIRWIEAHTDRSARILYQLDWDHGLPGPIPAYVEREFACAFWPDIPMEHNFVGFESTSKREDVVADRLYAKALEDYSIAELTAYLDLYNVGWVFANTKSANAVLSRYRETFVEQAAWGRVHAYEVVREPGFFISGSGHVTADYNRIEVSGASTGSVVLKYHWLESLRTRPALTIRPVLMMDDPVGFIMVENGKVRDFVIYNGYD